MEKLKVIEHKTWVVSIPKGTKGKDIYELFFRYLGWGIVTTKDAKIELQLPTKEVLDGKASNRKE